MEVPWYESSSGYRTLSLAVIVARSGRSEMIQGTMISGLPVQLSVSSTEALTDAIVAEGCVPGMESEIAALMEMPTVSDNPLIGG